ncbi:hypothetical protein KP509_15G074900 [Ceratopteris richardii]|nr:hypothetical protein KP509_15G074900 [Ceratopteris richardii]
MFAKCGFLTKAQEEFDKLTKRTLVLWNALTTGYANHGHGDKVLQCMEQMRCEHISPDAVTCICGLRACGIRGDESMGWQLYLEIVKKGYERDIVVGSTLVDMFVKCGCIMKAQSIFDKLSVRNVVTWNALITGYSEQGDVKIIFDCYNRMKTEGVSANQITLSCILKACGSVGAIQKGHYVNAEILKKGFEKDLHVGCSLVDMYGKTGCLNSAQTVFYSLPSRDVVLWNALIMGFVDQGCHEEVLVLVEQMQKQHIFPNSATCLCVLKACINIKSVEAGFTVHLDILKKGLGLDLLVQNSLLDMYAKSGLLLEARHVFEELPVHTAVSWNILIGGLCENGQDKEAIKCCRQMQDEGIVADAITLACALRSCISTKDFVEGQAIFSNLIKKGFLGHDTYIGSSLVDLYMSGGMVLEADLVFKKLLIKDEFTWAALIRGYVENDQIENAFGSFDCMKQNGVSCDSGVYVCVLRAVGRDRVIERGQKLHDEIIQKGFEMDSFTANNLVDMYAKCGYLMEAKHVGKMGLVSDVDMWTALIVGYTDYSGGEAALMCFDEMQQALLSPSVISFVFSMKSCGSICDKTRACNLYIDIIKRGLEKVPSIANALIDMHVKCCLVEVAQSIFDGLTARDVVSWNALIAGYVHHGPIENAIKCFEQMELQGVAPNAVTLVSIMKACSSVNWIEKTHEFYTEVINRGFETEPIVGSMLVDMHAKCDKLNVAHEIFQKIPTHHLILYNALIAGYADAGFSSEVLECYQQMHCEGIAADVVTFVCCLKACAATRSLDQGQYLHSEVTKKGFEKELPVGNILVDMYAKCSSLIESQYVFCMLPKHNAISWTALIGGFADSGWYEEAISCVDQMQQDGIALSSITYVCSLKTCGNFLAADKGRKLHAEILKIGLMDRDVFVGGALVDMYVNCGLVDEAYNVFENLPDRDATLWTVLISGLYEKGTVDVALLLYEEMKIAGVSPDAFTFVCTLKACGSIGVKGKAEELHIEILKKGLESDLFIREILVDVYAKTGLLTTAAEVFKSIHVRDVLLGNALIAGYAQLGDCDNAFGLFGKLLLEGEKPDGSTFLNLLTACSHAGLMNEGYICLTIMYDSFGVVPAVEHCSCMLDLLGRAGSIDAMAVLLDGMPMHPNILVLLSVIGACRKWGFVELGRLAFENAVLLNGKDAAAYVGMWNIYAGAAIAENPCIMDDTL